ncbi:MAG: hypothetical protein QHI38_10550 [Armatimonadota bacterium]|jgi:hypothetical protein|nr:hypothetical protein [Armatimonadota bacterium]
MALTIDKIKIDFQAAEIAVLKYLAKNTHSEYRYYSNICGEHFRKKLEEQLPSCKGVHYIHMNQVIWSLVRQGLIYLIPPLSGGSGWILELTENGKRAATDGVFNPYDHENYIRSLRAKVPDISATVLQYSYESLVAFRSDCYLASAVMLGVASETAFLEMGVSFAGWLTGAEQIKFADVFNKVGVMFSKKFEEFRKRIEAHKSDLLGELADNMSLTLDSVADLLRIYRNDAGHPTGKTMSKDDALINLQMFARYLQKLYEFKRFFDTPKPGTT